MKIFRCAVGLIAASLAVAGPALAADRMQKIIAAALYDLDRPLEQRRLDGERKAGEVVVFSGVRPGSKVLELMPAEGYWTRIFSRVIGPGGHIYPFAAMLGPPFWSQAAKDAAKAAGHDAPENPLAAAVIIQNTTSYGNVTAILESLLAYGGTVGIPEQVDLATAIDTYSSWYGVSTRGASDAKPIDMVAVNRAVFRALKPGAHYLVLDYAAPVGTGTDAAARLRRVDPQVLKQDLIAAGFVLDGESELLRNPADDGTRVSSDPALGGRADQLLLRFKKPDTAVRDQRHPDKDLANYYGNTFHLGPSPNLRILYHPDHRYQEYEDKGGRLTSGYWYADADGHFCLYHQTGPALGFVACHPFAASAIHKKPGDRWVEYGASHEPWQVWLEPGIVFPELAAAP